MPLDLPQAVDRVLAEAGRDCLCKSDAPLLERIAALAANTNLAFLNPVRRDDRIFCYLHRLPRFFVVVDRAMHNGIPVKRRRAWRIDRVPADLHYRFDYQEKARAAGLLKDEPCLSSSSPVSSAAAASPVAAAACP